MGGSRFSSSPTLGRWTSTAGQSAAYAIQVIPQYGSFDSPVTLTCTGLPRNATASISPGRVTPGSSTAAFALNIATRATSGAAAGTSRGAGAMIPPSYRILSAILMLACRLIICRFRSWALSLRSLAACAHICMLGLIIGFSAGGGNNQNTGTPPGTYQLAVQGESGNLKASTTVTLVVR